DDGRVGLRRYRVAALDRPREGPGPPALRDPANGPRLYRRAGADHPPVAVRLLAGGHRDAGDLRSPDRLPDTREAGHPQPGRVAPGPPRAAGEVDPVQAGRQRRGRRAVRRRLEEAHTRRPAPAGREETVTFRRDPEGSGFTFNGGSTMFRLPRVVLVGCLAV